MSYGRTEKPSFFHPCTQDYSVCDESRSQCWRKLQMLRMTVREKVILGYFSFDGRRSANVQCRFELNYSFINKRIKKHQIFLILFYLGLT